MHDFDSGSVQDRIRDMLKSASVNEPGLPLASIPLRDDPALGDMIRSGELEKVWAPDSSAAGRWATFVRFNRHHDGHA